MYRTAIVIILSLSYLSLLQGFNATLTEPTDAPGRRGRDQIREMELKLHPELKDPLTALCSDPKTTIVVLSGSKREVLDDVLHLASLLLFDPFNVYPILNWVLLQNFGKYNMWLAAENGMFLRYTKGDWMTTMPEHLSIEWVDSVKVCAIEFTTPPVPN